MFLRNVGSHTDCTVLHHAWWYYTNALLFVGRDTFPH
jgi:hypothetical protein